MARPPLLPSLPPRVSFSYAVRRLKSSPHQPGVVGSVSYDMSLRLWDVKVRRTLLL